MALQNINKILETTKYKNRTKSIARAFSSWSRFTSSKGFEAYRSAARLIAAHLSLRCQRALQTGFDSLRGHSREQILRTEHQGLCFFMISFIDFNQFFIFNGKIYV